MLAKKRVILIEISFKFTEILCWHYPKLLPKSELVRFLLIESVICLFTDSPVKKYISFLNQFIITN